MEMRTVGSLEVSVAGLGCNNFGMRIDEDASKLVGADDSCSFASIASSRDRSRKP